MKKIIYGLLLLFVIGIVGSFISISSSGGFSFDSYNVSDKVMVNNKDISQIKIDFSSTDLTVHPTSDEQITVELNGKVSKKFKKKLKLDVKENGDTLAIGLKGEDQIWFNIGVTFSDTHVDVYLPERVYKSFKVEVTSGDIEMQEVKAKEFSLEVSSGDIVAKDIEGINAYFNATSGNIKLSNVKGDVSLHTSSGDMFIQNKEISGNIKAKATSGDVKVEFDHPPKSLAIDFKATSGEGEISLDGVSYDEKSDNEIRGKIGSGEYKLKVDITSGDFSLR